MSDELAFTPALELAARVRAGEVSPVELAQLYLDRIEPLDPQLNAFVTVGAEGALEAAREPRRPGPPFAGVPISIKDLNDTAGIRTILLDEGAAPANVPARHGRRPAHARGRLRRDRQDEHTRAGHDPASPSPS